MTTPKAAKRNPLPPSLLQHPGIWRNRQSHRAPVVGTGHARLDEALPEGGWPVGALSELLSEQPGVGELSLLLPTLARMTGAGRWVVLVDPPWTPYPSAMQGHGVDLDRVLLVRTATPEESLWACEQSLRGLHGGMVLAWPEDRTAGFARLRRLQLAARTGHKLAFLFRAANVAGAASPAALRLHLHADENDLNIHVLKCRGARPTNAIRLRRQHQSISQGTPPRALQEDERRSRRTHDASHRLTSKPAKPSRALH